MLSAYRSQADDETEFHVVSHDSDIFISFSFGKMLFSVLQVSVRHFTLRDISDFIVITGCIGRPIVKKAIVLKQ